MSRAIQNRLKKELNQLTDNPICGSTVLLEEENNIRKWIVCVKGPVETPYEGGNFKLKFDFPDNYPFKPPEVKFITTMYHPNIKKDTGEICLDVFANGWLPTQKCSEILEKIISIIKLPSSSSPLEPDIANEFSNNYEQFCSNVKSFTKKY